ncbi:hypothetical protein B2I21_29395, partial [Chryseobacterium mucoviscidosis]
MDISGKNYLINFNKIILSGRKSTAFFISSSFEKSLIWSQINLSMQSRRKFLKKSAVASLALAVNP